jgi:hypothetical protein
MTGRSIPTALRRQLTAEARGRCAYCDGSKIVGLTPVGRATAIALNLNHPLIVEARRLWSAVGWHPPKEDY